MRSRAIIHLDRFRQNIDSVKKRTGRLICVPVKANAYGHGAREISRAAMESGAFCLGVATASEGTELRNGAITAPILLFSQPHPTEIPEVIDSALTPFVSDSWFAGALNEYAAARKIKVPVHLKIDTGMGRMGCRIEEALSLARHIAGCPALELTGTATHFAVSDSVNDDDIAYTKQQISLFNESVQTIRDAGIDPGIVHAANSGAVILHPDAWFDMVRPGIMLYGYVTVEESELSELCYQIKPVMELAATVSLIKPIKKGESVSYGRTWVAPCNTNIAVLSIGYGDGFPRLVSNKWQVIIDGKTYPLVGRICMDQCCADIGQDDVKRWDNAVIFGGAAQDAAALAKVVGTIPYEITCNINKRVERVYVGN